MTNKANLVVGARGHVARFVATAVGICKNISDAIIEYKVGRDTNYFSA